MILALVDRGVAANATQQEVCAVIGVHHRSVQRWALRPGLDDRRAGPHTVPRNKLSNSETRELLQVLNSPELRNLSPRLVVPLLADQGIYLASESTMYRVLKAAGQLKHRSLSKPPTRRHRPQEHTATGKNQVWSWDITYLKSSIRGMFHYLYVVLDVWSRKIVGWAIHDVESSEHAASLIVAACAAEGIDGPGLVLHSDNGAPMKGSTLLATLTELGVASSFSRPSVSNDNAFSEAVFKTTKYCPMYPSDGVFASLEAARAWMVEFEHWYNFEHLHSGIRYVTPIQRHEGLDTAILKKRRAVYAAARRATRCSCWARAAWARRGSSRTSPAPGPASSTWRHAPATTASSTRWPRGCCGSSRAKRWPGCRHPCAASSLDCSRSTARPSRSAPRPSGRASTTP